MKLSGVFACAVLAFLLCACPSASNWLTYAEQDLPILTTQATNILQLVDPSGADAALAGKVSGVAGTLLGTVNNAVAAYKLNPTATNLQKITASIDAAGKDLPATLQAVAGQFTNATELAAVSAAVDGIVVTLDIVAAQIGTPSVTQSVGLKRTRVAGVNTAKVPTAKDLKKQWNANVCSLTPARCPRF